MCTASNRAIQTTECIHLNSSELYTLVSQSLVKLGKPIACQTMRNTNDSKVSYIDICKLS